MCGASVQDQFEGASDELVALAGNEFRNVDMGDPVNDWDRRRQHNADPAPVLEWRGPVAFSKAYGSLPGIDHDFGRRWGSNRDQRISLRVEPGCGEGLLYVYDPTWDEYAVIGTDVPLAAVKDAFARALQVGDQLALQDFVSLVPDLPTVRTSPGPEL